MTPPPLQHEVVQSERLGATHPPTVQSVSAETAVNAARLKLFDADTASCSERHARLSLGRDDAAAARIALRYTAAAAKFTTLSSSTVIIHASLPSFFSDYVLTLSTESGVEISLVPHILGDSVAEWLACWTQAQNGLGSNRSRDAVR